MKHQIRIRGDVLAVEGLEDLEGWSTALQTDPLEDADLPTADELRDEIRELLSGFENADSFDSAIAYRRSLRDNIDDLGVKDH